MSPTPHLNELGEFLKARRSELSPRAVGLADSGGQRRVAGLRREEVAQLASISTDYYTRGQVAAPSTPVLEAVAQALHLDDDQRRYVFDLAGKRPPGPAAGPGRRCSRSCAGSWTTSPPRPPW